MDLSDEGLLADLKAHGEGGDDLLVLHVEKIKQKMIEGLQDQPDVANITLQCPDSSNEILPAAFL